MTSFIVNTSTSLVQVDSSAISPGVPAVVLLSSLNSPGSIITIRDSYGAASGTKKIVISTMTGLNFLDGPLVSSYVITQPYGFVTVSPKTTSIWAVVNTFAFPDQSATAIVNNLNTNNIRVSTITNDSSLISTAGISSLIAGNLYVYTSLSVAQSTLTSTLAVRDMAIFEKNVTILSSLNVGSSITTSSMLVASSLKVNQLDLQMSTGWVMDAGGPVKIAGPLSTLSTISAGETISTLSNLGVGQSTMIYGQLQVNRDSYFREGLSTFSKLGIGAEAQFFSTLSVKGEVLLYSNVSTTSNLNVGGGLSTLLNVNIDRELFVRSSITTLSTISTNWDINVGRNLSVQQTVAVGGDIVYKNRVLDFTNFSVLQDLFVLNNISTYSSIYAGLNLIVNGSTSLLGPVSTGSTLTALSHFSTQGNLAVGGSANFLSTLLVSSAVSTLWNMTVRGVISTQSSLAVGDAVWALREIVSFSNISTPSSIIAGNQLTVGGYAMFNSSLSTVGQAAFFSSLQIQGSLSVFSSVGVSCNLTVGGVLTANSFALPGAAQISSLAVMQQSNFTLTVSSSTLQVGLFSTMGDIRMGGRFSTQNVVAVGSTLFAGFVTAQSNISSLGSLGVFGDTNMKGNLTVGAQTSNIGAVTMGDTLTVTNATTLNGATQINNSLTATGNVQFQSFLQVNNTINALNGLQITAANNCNLISNYTHMSSLGVRGPAGFSTTVSIESTLNATHIWASSLQGSTIFITQGFTSSLLTSSITASNMFLSNTLFGSNAAFSTVDVRRITNSSLYGSTVTTVLVYASSLFTSSLWMSRELLGSNAGFSTLNVSRGVASSIITSSLMTCTVNAFQLFTSSFMTSTITTSNFQTSQMNTSSVVCSSIAIRNATPLALLDILGGSVADGTFGSNMIAFQYNGGGYRHFVGSRHNSAVPSACNAIDFWLNNSGTASGSSTSNTGNSIGMTITALGTGILTQNPSYGLDVNSNCRVVNNLTVNQSTILQVGNYALTLSQRDAAASATIQALNTGTQTPTSLLLNPDIRTNSRVGILCNAPSYAFDVGDTAMIASTLYFRNRLGRKLSLYGETANAYYGFEVNAGELRTTASDIGYLTYGVTNATPTFTEWARMSTSMLFMQSNIYIKGVGNNVARLILGPSPSIGNNDYCSLIQSSNTASANYASELSFWTHGATATYADPTRAITIDSSQRTYMYAVNTYAGRAQNPMPANLILSDTGTSMLLKLGAYYTSAQGGGGVIQSTDYFSNLDHGSNLFINPLGGNVAIGTSTAPTNQLEVNGNTVITGNLTVTGTVSGGGSFVKGMIILWYGSAATVPTGWKICDGSGYTVGGTTYTTPDLRQRVVVQPNNRAYNQGDTNAVTRSTVILNINQIPPHRHLSGQYYSNGDSGSAITYQGVGTPRATNFNGGIFDSAGNTVTAEGSNPVALDIRQPYYCLWCIMYVGV